MLTLIEKASQEYDEQKALEMAEKMRENTFDFNDFIDQIGSGTKHGTNGRLAQDDSRYG